MPEGIERHTMKRNASSLAGKEFDVIVVGAGIFGACVAWDATLRGLSVALVEKGDFCNATSANHYKFVHGGIRYLQHADFARVRESSHERSALLRIAPHLVRPQPIVIPTYGHGTKGKGFLRAGFTIYDLVTADRNRGITDPDRKIPRGTFISKDKVHELFPGLKTEGLTGGAIFYDGQYYSPPRLAVSFIRSAVNAGAEVANYAEVNGYLKKNDRVCGVNVKDKLSGDSFDIKGKLVINAVGPWSNHLLKKVLDIHLDPEPTFSRDLGFVIRRRLTDKYSFACQLKSVDKDSVLDRGGRHVFISPWRDYTLIGVWHVVFNKMPEQVSVTRDELQGYIDEVNEAYPDFKITIKDVSMINTGLTLFGEESKQGKKEISFGKRSKLIDHNIEHNIDGLITLIGVRATTARGMAEKAVDLALMKIGKPIIKSETAVKPIYGGNIDCFEKYVSELNNQNPYDLDNRVIRCLAHNYGSELRNVLDFIKEDPSLAEKIPGTDVLKAEVVHAVREEMAFKLGDVVFFRTDLGTGANPGEEALRVCAEIMKRELRWDEDKMKEEISDVKNYFEKLGFLRDEPEIETS